MRDGVIGNLVSLRHHLLHQRVVGVIVADKERPLDGAAVGVSVAIKKSAVVLFVVYYSDGVIHAYRDDLRSLREQKSSRDAKVGAATIWQAADSWVAW